MQDIKQSANYWLFQVLSIFFVEILIHNALVLWEKISLEVTYLNFKPYVPELERDGGLPK